MKCSRKFSSSFIANILLSVVLILPEYHQAKAVNCQPISQLSGSLLKLNNNKLPSEPDFSLPVLSSKSSLPFEVVTPPWINYQKVSKVSVDIIFLVDGSGSMKSFGRHNFDLVKTWIKNVASGFDISKDSIRIGVVQYSHRYLHLAVTNQPYIKTEITLGDNTDKKSFDRDVDKIKLMGYTTYTGAAIYKTVDADFAKSKPNTKKIIVLLTDGSSRDDIIASSAYARRMNITFFCVGIGDYQLPELQTIANGEQNNNLRVYQAQSFNRLSSTVTDLQNEIRAEYQVSVCPELITPVYGTLKCSKANLVGSKCTYSCHGNSGFKVLGNSARICTMNPVLGPRWTGEPATCGECSAKFDLLVILDSSSSIGSSNFNIIKEFILRLVDTFEIGPNNVQVSIIRYNRDVLNLWKYNTYSDKESLRMAIFGISYSGSGTRTAKVLNYAWRCKFSRSSGRRRNLPHLTLILTDGNSSNIRYLKERARRLRLKSKVIAVGLSGSSRDEVHRIISDPTDRQTYNVINNYAELLAIVRDVAQKLCKAEELVLNTTCPMDGLLKYRNNCSLPSCTNSNFLGSACIIRPCKGARNKYVNCYYNGVWCTSSQDCSANRCPEIPLSPNLIKKCNHGDKIDSTCRLRCKDGYAFTGQSLAIFCEINKANNFINCINSCKLQNNQPRWRYPMVSCIEIDECLSLPCQNNGSCIDGKNSFTCICRPGFNGNQCENDINECETNPCFNGGRCVDAVNSFRCDCLEGFTGETCLKSVDKCNPNPCENNGNCTNVPKGYECVCAVGFEGMTCEKEVDWCESNPCYNDAECYSDSTGYFCVCNPGFTGIRCEDEIGECESNVCMNNGTCSVISNNTVCECPTGYSGKHCEFSPNGCNSSPCSNSSTCLQTDARPWYKCICPPGYKGQHCNFLINDCNVQVNLCQNNGECVEETNGLRCDCMDGFSGEYCQYNNSLLCTNELCKNGGTCQEEAETGYRCICPDGYAGTHCDVLENQCHNESVNQCKHGSACRPHFGGISCECTRGYFGRFCEREIRCAIGNRNTHCFGEGKPGTTCFLHCPNKTTAGSKQESVPMRRICLDNGTWSVPNNRWNCDINTCAELTNIPRPTLRATIRISSNLVKKCTNRNYIGSECRFSCRAEYQLHGVNWTTCNSDGHWSYEIPKCKRSSCPSLIGVTVCSDAFKAGSVCNRTCPIGYGLRGPLTKVCEENFQWEPEEVWECVSVSCIGKPPMPEHSEMRCNFSNSPGSVCTSKCEVKFIEIAKTQYTCTLINNQYQWIGTLGECVLSSCDKTIDLRTGRLTGFRSSSDYASVVVKPRPLRNDTDSKCNLKAVIALQNLTNKQVTLDLWYNEAPYQYHLGVGDHIRTNGLQNLIGNPTLNDEVTGFNSSLLAYSNMEEIEQNETSSRNFSTHTNIFEPNGHVSLQIEDGDIIFQNGKIRGRTGQSSNFSSRNNIPVYVGLNRLSNLHFLFDFHRTGSGLCYVCVNSNSTTIKN